MKETAFLIIRKSKNIILQTLSPFREAIVYEGPNPAEGHLPVNSPAEEQHGIWLYDYRR